MEQTHSHHIVSSIAQTLKSHLMFHNRSFYSRIINIERNLMRNNTFPSKTIDSKQTFLWSKIILKRKFHWNSNKTSQKAQNKSNSEYQINTHKKLINSLAKWSVFNVIFGENYWFFSIETLVCHARTQTKASVSKSSAIKTKSKKELSTRYNTR